MSDADTESDNYLFDLTGTRDQKDKAEDEQEEEKEKEEVSAEENIELEEDDDNMDIYQYGDWAVSSDDLHQKTICIGNIVE